jgi:hypothetical protein
VAAFLEAGMSATDAGTTGMPPLHHALMFACTYGVRPSSEAAHRIVAELLAHGADPNAVDEMGNPALHRAAGPCDGAIIELIAARRRQRGQRHRMAVLTGAGERRRRRGDAQAGFKYGSAGRDGAGGTWTTRCARLIERAGGGDGARAPAAGRS